MSWVFRAVRNYLLIITGVVVADLIYVAVGAPTSAQSPTFDLSLAVVLILLMTLVLGPPTVGLAWLLARPASGVTQMWMVRLLTFLLTFWVPGLLFFLMIEMDEFLFAVVAQVIFACTLPTNRARSTAREPTVQFGTDS